MIIDLKRLKLDKVVIRHSLDIYEFIRHVIRIERRLFNMVKEHLFVLSINRKSYVISLELVALGSDSQVTADPVEVFSLPVYKRAAGVILVHNHPSGTLQPSEEDRDVTDRLIQSGRILKRPVIDHVIITDYSYYSFKDSGLLECIENSLKYVPPYELERQFYDQMQQEIKRLKKEHKIKNQQSLQKVAKNMLKEGLKPQVIQKVTGLSQETINSL